MQALYFNQFGDSDVLHYGELPEPTIDDYQILVKMQYIGLNYADIYRRKGNYHIEKRLPYINGYEGVGIVYKTGSKVTRYVVGETILFVDVPRANAELVVVPEDSAIKVPADLDLELVASIGLQGLTSDFLVYDLGRHQPNDNVFVHGISGGVGQILSQMLSTNGVNVYGVTSSEQKKELALKQGAKKIFLRNDREWIKQYKGFFDTVYDGIGTTLHQSIDLIKHRGSVIFFGMAGGNPPAIDCIQLLSESKSILTGDLWDYLTSYAEREKRSNRLFKYFQNDKITITKPNIFALRDGKHAHDLLESGNSIGKILLKP